MAVAPALLAIEQLPKVAPMLINKIFHLHKPVAEARQCLREVGAREAVGDAEIHGTMLKPAGVGRFEVGSLSTDIEEVAGLDPNRILFRSVAGSLDVAGVVELFPIRENLTEVVLTLDYETPLPLQRLAGIVDRFLNRHLARLEQCAVVAR
jgi:hypothetical protein